MKFKTKHLYKWVKTLILVRDPRLTAMIGLTYFCQCSCPHCSMAGYKKDKRDELSTRELLDLINGFSRTKIKGVYFFGGEPLLRDDILELINCVHKKKIVPFLDSNGYLITKDFARKLKNAGLRIIGISIDSPYPEIHDKLRGVKGSFERAVEAIKNCLDERINVYISAYATKENLRNGDLEKIITLGEELGVNSVRIMPPLALGKWLGREDIKLNQQEEKLLAGFHRFGFVEIEGEHCSTSRKKLFYLSPYGEVQPCCNIPYNFGNIRKEPWQKILKRMWSHPMFKMISGIKGCPVGNKDFQEKYYSGLASINKFPLDSD